MRLPLVLPAEPSAVSTEARVASSLGDADDTPAWLRRRGRTRSGVRAPPHQGATRLPGPGLRLRELVQVVGAEVDRVEGKALDALVQHRRPLRLGDGNDGNVLDPDYPLRLGQRRL